MADEQPTNTEHQESAPPRDPFAYAHPSEYYWIQLKPVYKGRLMLHGERLVQVAVTHEQVASLELLRLEIRTDEDSAATGTNYLELLVDHKHQRVRFGPLQGVHIFPAKRGVAGFLLAQLIDWAQRKYAEYRVTPIILHPLPDDETLQLRERLLKRAGFHRTYDNEARTQGKAQANRVGDLVASWNIERVQRLHVGEMLQQLRDQELQNRQQLAQLTTLQARLEEYKRNDLGHRFAIGCLIIFSVFQALMRLWVVLR